MKENKINELKEYEKELERFLKYDINNMNTFDKAVKKLKKETKKELQYIKEVIKQEIVKEVF